MAVNLNIETSRAKFDHFMKGLPEDQRHLLFIDKRVWEQIEPVPHVDCMMFDNEPGYHAAMTQALNFVRDHLGEKLNATKFCTLHDLCVDNVYHDAEMKKPFLKGFRPKWGYEFDYTKVSKETRLELENEKILLYPDRNADSSISSESFSHIKNLSFLSVYLSGHINSCFYKEKQLPKVIEKIDGLFVKYYARIESAKSEDDRLAAMASLCLALEIFHVFADANARTIQCAMLSKLLIENNFSPVILDNPRTFDEGYFSISEMVELLKDGMKNFKKVVEQFSQIAQIKS